MKASCSNFEIKRLLLILFCLICAKLSFAATWPNPLIISGDMANAPPGTILHRIPISHTFNAEKWLTGIAYLQVDPANSISNEMDKKGVFSISENDDLGVAFIGSLAVRFINSQKDPFVVTKSSYDENLAPIGLLPWVTATPSLIRMETGTFADSGENVVSVVGEVVIVKLSNDSIQSKLLTLPDIRLVFGSQALPISGKGTNILVTQSTAVAGQRSCQIFANGTSFDFGIYKSNVPPGALTQNHVTEIYVSCSDGGQDTQVHFSIESETKQGNDPTAIGMVFAQGVSSNLVVKAKDNPELTTDCSTRANWIELDKTYKTEVYKASNQSVGGTYPIYWTLCRKQGAIPTGKFHGSAVVNITFN